MDLGKPQCNAIVFSYSRSVITLTENNAHPSKNKYISIKYHFKITVKKVHTSRAHKANSYH